MRFNTVGKNKRLTEKVIDQLSDKETDHYVDGLGQDHSAKISFHIAGHGQEHHQNGTNQRAYVGDQVEQGTQKCDDDGVFDPEDQQNNAVHDQQYTDLK